MLVRTRQADTLRSRALDVDHANRVFIDCTVVSDGDGDFGAALKAARELLRAPENRVCVAVLCFAHQQPKLLNMVHGLPPTVRRRLQIEWHTADTFEFSTLTKLAHRCHWLTDDAFKQAQTWPATRPLTAAARQALREADAVLTVPVNSLSWNYKIRQVASDRGVPHLAALALTEPVPKRLPGQRALLGLGPQRDGVLFDALQEDEEWPLADQRLQNHLLQAQSREIYTQRHALFVNYLPMPSDWSDTYQFALTNCVHLALCSQKGGNRDIDIIGQWRLMPRWGVFDALCASCEIGQVEMTLFHGKGLITQAYDSRGLGGLRRLRLLDVGANYMDYKRLLALSRDCFRDGVMLSAAMGESSYGDLLGIVPHAGYYPILVPRYKVQDEYGLNLAQEVSNHATLSMTLGTFASYDFRHDMVGIPRLQRIAATLLESTSQHAMQQALHRIRNDFDYGETLRQWVVTVAGKPRRPPWTMRIAKSALCAALAVGFLWAARAWPKADPTFR